MLLQAEPAVFAERATDLNPGIYIPQALNRSGEDSGLCWCSINDILDICNVDAELVEVARELYDRPAIDGSSRSSGKWPASKDYAPRVQDDTDAQEPANGTRKPDPTAAIDAVEFVQTMAAYRVWAGKRSYRKMATAIGDRYVPSTLSGIPNRTTLPSLDLVTAYIQACDGDLADIDVWQRAWRNLALSQPSQMP